MPYQLIPEDELRQLVSPSFFELQKRRIAETAPEQPEINPEAGVSVRPPMESGLDAIQKMLAAREAKIAPSLEKQERGVELLQQQAALLAGMPVRTDLSPLMHYADYLAGGKGTAAAGYKAPESGESRSKALIKLGQMLQESRNDLTGRNIQSANDKVALRMFGDKGRDERFDNKQVENFAKSLGDRTSKINLESSDAAGKLNKLEDIYQEGDIRKITSVLGDVAKYIGGNVGATSDPDAARQLYETMNVTLEKWATKFGQDGKLPPEETKSMVDLIRASRDITRDIYKNKYTAVGDEFTMRADSIGRPDIMYDDGIGGKYLRQQIDKIEKTLTRKQGGGVNRKLIPRTTEDGKTALFDAETKEFVRYE